MQMRFDAYTIHLWMIRFYQKKGCINTYFLGPGTILACKSESAGFWWCGRWGGCTTALHHCSIQISSGSETEGRSHVCCSTLNRTNTHKGGLKVKVRTLYGWDITTSQYPWISGCKLHKSSIQNWSSTPADKKSLNHSAGIGHLLPRTGSLPPIQSGAQGDGG